MKVLFLLCGVGLLVGSFAAFGSRIHVLSAGECQAVTGSEADKVCAAVATCDAYNHQTYGMVVCPNEPTDFCQTCQYTGNRWQTCEVQAGSNCTMAGEASPCGAKRNGYCDENNQCANTAWYGPVCHDAPYCGAPLP
jgi:hypothetical protein